MRLSLVTTTLRVRSVRASHDHLSSGRTAPRGPCGTGPEAGVAPRAPTPGSWRFLLIIVSAAFRLGDSGRRRARAPDHRAGRRRQRDRDRWGRVMLTSEELALPGSGGIAPALARALPRAPAARRSGSGHVPGSGHVSAAAPNPRRAAAGTCRPGSGSTSAPLPFLPAGSDDHPPNGVSVRGNVVPPSPDRTSALPSRTPCSKPAWRAGSFGRALRVRVPGDAGRTATSVRPAAIPIDRRWPG